MYEALTQLIARIARDQELLNGVEEAVRQGAVLPLLAQLGWDTYNIREVAPEYSVGSGRVDYCLRVGERRLAFVEVKRVSQDLVRHEQQLLQYAFTEGVEIAALTNGVTWWLYLPLSGGSWSQRRFLAVDIQQQEPNKAAEHFVEFLSKSAVFDGTAVKQARFIHDSKQKQLVTEEIIPKAWHQILYGQDASLIELIADRVESICGYRPEPEQIRRFLQEQFPPEVTGGIITRAKATNVIKDDMRHIFSRPVASSSRFHDSRRLNVSLGHVLDVFTAMTQNKLTYNDAAKSVAASHELKSVNTIYDACTRKIGINTDEFKRCVADPALLYRLLLRYYSTNDSEIRKALGL